jgi:hypothetical protein
MNGSSASSNMGTHHMHMNPHIVQMSNGQVFMTSNPYANPQALHLQRYQVPNTQGVNKQVFQS